MRDTQGQSACARGDDVEEREDMQTELNQTLIELRNIAFERGVVLAQTVMLERLVASDHPQEAMDTDLLVKLAFEKRDAHDRKLNP
jgi:hypothetical protein